MWHHGWVLLIISHHPTTFGGRRRCAREDISESHVTLWLVSFAISEFAEFGDHRPFGRGNTNLSIFYVTPRDHVFRYHAWVFIIIRNYLATFFGPRTCRKRAILLLIGHLTSHDHVVNGLCRKSYFIHISRLLSVCVACGMCF